MSSIATQDVDLGDRRQYIGGSDIGSIMGVNPHRTPVQVYYEKLGETPAFQGNEATRWGTLLENVIALEYGRREGVKVIRDRKMYRHPRYDYLLGHIDRRVLNIEGGKGLEVKTAGKWFKPQEWEEEPPRSYQLQCQWYMMLTTWEAFDLAALLAGNDFRIYPIERDEFLQREMVEVAIEFMARVRERRPPSPMNEEDCRRIWSYDNGETVIANEDVEKKVKVLVSIQSEIKRLAKLESEHKTAIMEFMSPKSFLMSPAGEKLASWKNDNGIDFERLLAEHPEELKPYLEPKLKTEDFRKALPSLAKDYTIKSDKRVLRISAKE